MKSILWQFAENNLETRAASFRRKGRLAKLMDEAAKRERALLCRLDDAGKALLAEYQLAEGDVLLHTEEERFVRGYSLGVLMTMEVFLGAEDIAESVTE